MLTEAGARAKHRPLLRDLGIPGVPGSDSRQLDVVASGLPLFGGKSIVGDAMRSAITGDRARVKALVQKCSTALIDEDDPQTFKSMASCLAAAPAA